jgi:TatD DNase family protein
MEIKVYPSSIDSHTHITEMEKKGLHTKDIFKKCFEQGMAAILDVAVNEQDFESRLAYKKLFPNIFFAAGIHPSDTKDIEKQITAIEKQLENPHVIAVGETGLDVHWDTVPADKQKEMFVRHIELSNKTKRPIIIHNRLADKELIEILSSEKVLHGGIIHCFSSNYHFAQKYNDL